MARKFKIGDWVVLVEDHYQPHAATIRLTLEHFRDKKTTVFPLLYHSEHISSILFSSPI